MPSACHCIDLFFFLLLFNSSRMVATEFFLPDGAALCFLKGIADIGEIHLFHMVSRGETEEGLAASIKYGGAMHRFWPIHWKIAKKPF